MTLNYRIGTETDSNLVGYTGFDAINDAGFGWFRFVDMDWAKHHIFAVNTDPYDPSGWGFDPHVDNWDAELAASIQRATDAGMKVIMMVRNAPAQFTCSGVEGCGALKPAAYDALKWFMGCLVYHYKNHPYYVMHYELWNEPDSRDTTRPRYVGQWPDPFEYTKMLKVVYPYVKGLYPDVSIMNGGFELVDEASTHWVEQFITGRKYGSNIKKEDPGINYIDILAYHAYDNIQNGQVMWELAGTPVKTAYWNNYYLVKRLIGKVPDVLPAHNKKVPIWMNEGGVLAQNETAAGHPNLRLGQSYFITQMMVDMLIDNRIGMYSWFRLVDWPGVQDAYFSSSLGDCYYWETPKRWVARTHFSAYQFSLSLLTGATYITTLKNSGYSGNLTHVFADGLMLAMNTNGTLFAPVYYRVPPPDLGDVWEIYDVLGNKIMESADSFDFLLDDPYKMIWIKSRTI